MSTGTRLISRVCELLARRCDMAAEKLSARSAGAESRGDRQSADRYRSRVDRQRERAEQCRRLPLTKGPNRSEKTHREMLDRSCRSGGVAEGDTGPDSQSFCIIDMATS